jgi:hypothetical protein
MERQSGLSLVLEGVMTLVELALHFVSFFA